jgi:hypothetical protein
MVMPSRADMDVRSLPPPPAWRPNKRGPLQGESPPELMDAPKPDRGGRSPAKGLSREVPAELEPGAANLSMPDVNVDGITFTGSIPPATIGEAGPNHYAQMTNLGVARLGDGPSAEDQHETRTRSWAAT